MKHVFLFPVLVFLIAFCKTSLAEDGLVVRFTITKEVSSAKRPNVDHKSLRTSYAKSVLISFNEQHSFELSDYLLTVGNKTENNKDVTLSFTLKDIIDDKPYYVGSDSVNLMVGKNHKMEFIANSIDYTLTVDTSYGKLPQ